MGHAARLKTEYSFQTESKTLLSREQSITALETHPLLFGERHWFFASVRSSCLQYQNQEPYHSKCLQQCRCLLQSVQRKLLEEAMNDRMVNTESYLLQHLPCFYQQWRHTGMSTIWMLFFQCRQACYCIFCKQISQNRYVLNSWVHAGYSSFNAALSFSQQQQGQQRGASDISFTIDANKQQRQLIAELENKNR